MGVFVTAFNAEEIARLRAVFGRMSRVLTREVETGEMTRTELSILASVARHGPIRLGELAEFEGINPTMLSRIVGKLDQAGFIERIADENDRRAARVEVTSKGRGTYRRLLSDRAQLLATAVDQLPAEQSSALLDALEALEALVGFAQPVAHRLPPKLLSTADRA
jgi:DNA-binding MarR family transcriptional regulator